MKHKRNKWFLTEYGQLLKFSIESALEHSNRLTGLLDRTGQGLFVSFYLRYFFYRVGLRHLIVGIPGQVDHSLKHFNSLPVSLNCNESIK